MSRSKGAEMVSIQPTVRHPERGKGERKLDCVHDSACLELAAKANWPSWHCGKCEQFVGRLPEPDPFVEEFTTTVRRQSEDWKMEQPQTKICTHCGVEKPLDQFHVQKAGKYGRRPDCKECCRKRLQVSRAGKGTPPRSPQITGAEWNPAELRGVPLDVTRLALAIRIVRHVAEAKEYDDDAQLVAYVYQAMTEAV